MANFASIPIGRLMTASNSRSPRLSIGIPVYNGESFLAQALDSLLAQTFHDFEIVISDNASTDRTPEICRAYARRDPRVRYVCNQRNLGAVANFNRVFELSTAPLFKWAAHDDLHRETYLESCIRLLDDDPEVVLAHCESGFIDETGEFFPFIHETGSYVDPKTGVYMTTDGPEIGDSAVAVERFWQVLARARWGTHMFGVIRRASLEQTCLIRNFIGCDRALLAELALLGRFRSTPERLYLKRFHANMSHMILSSRERKNFLSTDGKPYWERARQLEAFLSAPRGKPIGAVDKFICTMMVAVHCVRIASRALPGRKVRNPAQALRCVVEGSGAERKEVSTVRLR
jgi:glycosyltransferase involved in cell wall biosynthesis